MKYVKLTLKLDGANKVKRAVFMFARLPFKMEEKDWFNMFIHHVRTWLKDNKYFFKHYKNYWENRAMPQKEKS